MSLLSLEEAKRIVADQTAHLKGQHETLTINDRGELTNGSWYEKADMSSSKALRQQVSKWVLALILG